MKKTYFLIMLILFTVAFISFLASAEYVEEYGKHEPYYHKKLVEEVNCFDNPKSIIFISELNKS